MRADPLMHQVGLVVAEVLLMAALAWVRMLIVDPEDAAWLAV